MSQSNPAFIAFAGARRIALGSIDAVARAVHARQASQDQSGRPELILVFEAATSALVDLDLRGDADEAATRALARFPAPADEPRGRGRPKLGVVAHEVTLLPRHWEWLRAQPGGASIALRKLVEAAARDPRQEARRAQDAAYKFMHAIAGDLPGFEEATRALFAKDGAAFAARIAGWPDDIRTHCDRAGAAGLRNEDDIVTDIHFSIGSTGAGKTTYARTLAQKARALPFSIDEWMQGLFAPDLKGASFAATNERVERARRQMWDVAAKAQALGVPSVFDTGLLTRASRTEARARSGPSRAVRALPLCRRARGDALGAGRRPQCGARQRLRLRGHAPDVRFHRDDLAGAGRRGTGGAGLRHGRPGDGLKDQSGSGKSFLASAFSVASGTSHS